MRYPGIVKYRGSFFKLKMLLLCIINIVIAAFMNSTCPAVPYLNTRAVQC